MPSARREQGRPAFGLSFYAVNKAGEYGAATIYPSRYALFDGEEASRPDTAYLYERDA